MIDLEQKYIDFIIEIVSKYLTDYKVYIFGSRAKGTAKKYSDIDIALSCKTLTENTLMKIKNDFENSTLPYEVDVVDLNLISDDFKNHIKDSLIEIKQ